MKFNRQSSHCWKAWMVLSVCLMPINPAFAQSVPSDFRIMENRAISGSNDNSKIVASPQECRDLCLSESDFVCKSADYTKATKKCDLSKSTLLEVDASRRIKNSAYDHFERANFDDFREIQNTAISGKNNRSFVGVSPATCRTLCLEEDGFLCRSVDYTKATKKCDLSDSTLSSSKVVKDAAYDHFERLSFAEDYERNSAGNIIVRGTGYLRYADRAISGHNDRRVENVSVRQCQALCNGETDFTCRSIDYVVGSRRCDLSAVTANEAGGLTSNKSVVHYHRSNAPKRTQSVLTLKRLRAINTTEIGTDEVAYRVQVDDETTDMGFVKMPTWRNSSKRNMDDGDIWNINKSFEFDEKIVVEFWEDDSSDDDTLGVLSYSNASKQGTFNKLKLDDDSVGIYEVDIALGGASVSLAGYDLVKQKSVFQKKSGNYRCDLDPWKERAAPEKSTGSACSIPKEFEGVDIDDLVNDKNYAKFHSVCQTHDLCYSAPWRAAGRDSSGQGYCDSAFYQDMLDKCDQTHDDGSPNWFECRGTATTIYGAVAGFGKSSYNGGQDWAEDHCKIAD